MRASGNVRDALAMDVVNGKIVETTTEGGGVMADHNNNMWSGLKPSRGFGGDAGSSRSVHHLKLMVDHAGNFAPQGGAHEWVSPSSWATSDDTALHTWDGAALAASTARWNSNGRVQDFTAPADHRQGWKRTWLWAMDVVNGKIVESARVPGKMEKAGDHHALGLKPSRARVVDGGGRRQDQCIHGKSGELPAGSFAREWAPSWASSCFGDEPMSWAPGGHGAHGAPNAVTPAWNTGEKAGDKARHGFPGTLQVPQPQTDHRQGWNRSPNRSPKQSPKRSPKQSNAVLSSPRWGNSDQCPYHFDSSPCSEGKLDEEMTMFESQMTRTVSGRFSNLTSVTSSLSQEISSHAQELSAPVVTDVGAASSAEKKSTEFVPVLKRKRSGLPDGEAPGECGWIQPLKLLVRKGLTVSDVGELGRIIVPKKDAESQSFPQIDTKEGTVLEMEDYSASKRWYFRFKYWINNKSRMYVLENTGEFIKYHSLKEHDIFVVYEDGCKKLVVCGQKKNSDNLDPVIELSKGSIVESSTSETPPTTTEDESNRKEQHLHHQHR